jgi:hypothetical protein
MLDRFHSKLHRYNHHTVITPGYLDSATDPIAAPQDPFKGDFYVQGVLSATYLEGLSGVRVGGGLNRGNLIATGLTAFRTYNFPNSTGVVLLDTTLTPYISALSAINTSLVQSSVVWVDALSGNDLTGARERSDKPFKTLNGAMGAALSGDVIYVHAGTYTDTGLGKAGVDWYFENNAIVNVGAVGVPIFQYNTLSYNVYGNATFMLSGNIVPTAGTGLVADFSSSTGTKNLFFEFQDIIVNSSATFDNTPTTSVFRGTFGNKNVHIKGNSIYAPKLCVFDSFKTLNSGFYYAYADISEAIVGQTIFNGSGHRLTTYVSAPVISATDYVFNDAGVTDVIDAFYVDASRVYGSVTKLSSTGPMYFDTYEFNVTPRAGRVWNTISSGNVKIAANALTTNIPLSTNAVTQFDLNSFTVTDATSAGTSYAISYGGGLIFNANTVSLTYSTSAYSMFHTAANSSHLRSKLGEVTNVSLGGYNLVYVDGVSASIVKVDVDNLINGADFHLWGTNQKARVRIGTSPNTFIDVKALSASTDSTFLFKGYYKTLSASNLKVEAVSGHSGTKLYLDSGTGFESTGTYNLDLSGVEGDPLNIYLIGTTITNKSPLDLSANFIVNCGMFESASAIAVPVF